MEGTLRSVVTAFAGNLAIAVAKFIGAFFTGSTALFAEGLHSVVDTVNEVFLYLGLHLENRPPTAKHPLGFGRERFFWSFLAALFIFAGGAIVSLYEGVEKVLHPHPIENVAWAVGVLAFAFVAEGLSFAVGFREFRRRASRLDLSLYPYFKVTRDPTLLTVLLEDAGALVGVSIAALGVGLTVATGDGRFDGAASIGIGLVLGVLAFVLGNRTRSLLLGASASPRVLEAIDRVFKDTPFVERVADAVTIQLAPDELVLSGHLLVAEDMSVSEASRRIQALERRLTAEVPHLKYIYLEIEPPDA